MEVNEQDIPDEQNHFKNLIDCVKNELLKAKKSVHLCMYILTNKEIQSLIIQLAETIHFRIICDKNSQNKKTISIFGQNIPNIDFLLPKNGAPRIHHKFCIVDDSILISGTANFSDRALLPHKSRNYEVIDISYSKKKIDKYFEEFERIWKEISDHNNRSTPIYKSRDCKYESGKSQSKQKYKFIVEEHLNQEFDDQEDSLSDNLSQSFLQMCRQINVPESPTRNQTNPNSSDDHFEIQGEKIEIIQPEQNQEYSVENQNDSLITPAKQSCDISEKQLGIQKIEIEETQTETLQQQYLIFNTNNLSQMVESQTDNKKQLPQDKIRQRKSSSTRDINESTSPKKTKIIRKIKQNTATEYKLNKCCQFANLATRESQMNEYSKVNIVQTLSNCFIMVLMLVLLFRERQMKYLI